MNDPASLARRCQQEISEVEQFFEGWIKGSLAQTEAVYHRFASVIAPTFHIVLPSGLLWPGAELVAFMRHQYGTDPATRRWVERVRLGHLSPTGAVFVFEEWQVRDGQQKRNLISALFEAAAGTPNGVRWLHVHETPLTP
jgi:hypothetical protein